MGQIPNGSNGDAASDADTSAGIVPSTGIAERKAGPGARLKKVWKKYFYLCWDNKDQEHDYMQWRRNTVLLTYRLSAFVGLVTSIFYAFMDAITWCDHNRFGGVSFYLCFYPDAQSQNLHYRLLSFMPLYGISLLSTFIPAIRKRPRVLSWGLVLTHMAGTTGYMIWATLALVTKVNVNGIIVTFSDGLSSVWSIYALNTLILATSGTALLTHHLYILIPSCIIIQTILAGAWFSIFGVSDWLILLIAFMVLAGLQAAVREGRERRLYALSIVLRNLWRGGRLDALKARQGKGFREKEEERREDANGSGGADAGGGGAAPPPQPTADSTPAKKVKDKDKKKEKDLEAGEGGAGGAGGGESDIMHGFFDEVSAIKEQIAGVKSNVEQIEQLHQKALNVISEEQSALNTKELDKMMDQTNKKAGEIRNKLKAMEAQNKQLEKKGDNPSDVRIRVTQHGGLTKRFLDVMMEYKDIQKKYQDKYKQRLQRQFLIVKPQATPEEVEKMVSGETGPVFAQQIMQSGQRGEARRALMDIQDRHQDIVRIERSIIELQQLFMDMSVLVAAQGEVLNQIEVHVSNAVDHTEQGVQALAKAVKLQKKTRKVGCVVKGFCGRVTVGARATTWEEWGGL
ncbi:Syntaxin-1A [Rhizophlyctis rosea]|nr:Syntaxin-1A [Rhizophlyctis rosea]